MSNTGLLLISNVKQFHKTITKVQKYVNSLYIQLNIPLAKVLPVPSWGKLISLLYVDCHFYCSEIDMRILVAPLKDFNRITELPLKSIEYIFSDNHSSELCQTLIKKFNIPHGPLILLDDDNSDIIEYKNLEEEYKIYNTVVLGGTFDRIHVGHKIFLSQAVLKASCRIVVGVTTSELNKSKTLPELILPLEQRIKDVKDFLIEIDPTLQYEVVPISDIYGPTKTDPNMDLIVVSKETLNGGLKINEARKKVNLKTLEIYSIDMIENNSSVEPKVPKISSSNKRIDLLGTRLRKPVLRSNIPSRPYIIGLTGGIASGKSHMAERLCRLGAAVFDCDKIAHELYEPNQLCYEEIVNHFGKNILDSDSRINRSKLGRIVFHNTQQFDKLNSIVWPKLLIEVKRRIMQLQNQEKPQQVVVIEAAVLLKAGWEKECHEIWSMIVPAKEAVRRLKERNKLNENEAYKRLQYQTENNELVAKSNVVFSSQWAPAITQRQAEKAWNILIEELGIQKS